MALSYLPKCNISLMAHLTGPLGLALSMTEVSKTCCNGSLFLVNSPSLPFSYQRNQTCIMGWSLFLSTLRVHFLLSFTGIPPINSLTFHLQLFSAFQKPKLTQSTSRDYPEHLKMCRSMWNHYPHFLYCAKFFSLELCDIYLTFIILEQVIFKHFWKFSFPHSFFLSSSLLSSRLFHSEYSILKLPFSSECYPF